MLRPALWKYPAGAAIVLGGALEALAVGIIVAETIGGGLYGFLYSLVYGVPISVLAIPLILLGSAVWRRSREPRESV